jgi:hypothetical protein
MATTYSDMTAPRRPAVPEDRLSAMRAKRVKVRTVRDLENASRKIAEMFDTPVVVVVGSQAVLNTWGNKAPDIMRTSSEIDLYPGNRRAWEDAERRRAAGDGVSVLASEHIFKIAGEGSAFDEIHGFYLDGVDENTAPMPLAWQERAFYRDVPLQGGGVVTTVSPAIEDTIASKLVRLSHKDEDFITAAYDFRPFDVEAMKRRMAEIVPTEGYPREYLEECRARSGRFLDSLPKRPVVNAQAALEKQLARLLPAIPADTHCVFYNLADSSITVRKWEPDMGVYYKIDNPLGPAMVAKGFKHYVLDGRKVSEEDWAASRSVLDAKAGEPAGAAPPWKAGP